MNEELKTQIDSLVNSHKVFLFMKGTPDAPECGFSMRVTQTLKDQGVAFQSFNVFEDENVRHGIKEYANWPTIPQLYVDGKFVGGCDIVRELHDSGELTKLLAK